MVRVLSIIITILFSFSSSCALTVLNRTVEDNALSALRDLSKIPSLLSSVKKPLLCVVLANATSLIQEHGELFQQNLRVMKHYCDFAVISYVCKSSAVTEIEAVTRDVGVNLAMYRCVRGASADSHISKIRLYDRLLPLLAKYDRVWLLDEDISLAGFSPDTFFHTLNCAFWPRPPPLVVQPLVSENTQNYNFVNLNTWTGTGVVAAATTMVEIQMPMVNASFFDWYVRYIVKPTLDAFEPLLCAGFDAMFCRSAAAFAQATGVASADPASPYVPCAVITAPDTACSHIDTNTIPKGPHFVNASKQQAHVLGTVFPSFLFWNFKRVEGSFVSPTFADWERIKAIPPSCPENSAKFVKSRGKNKKNLNGQGLKESKLSIKGSVSQSFLDWLKDKKENGVDFVHELVLPVTLTKVYALHFPQFHSDPLNDAIWGPGYTDWDNLLATPTENKFGDTVLAPTELGYYNFSDYQTRKDQRKLAKRYGVDGFIYHHYWFNEPGLGATMARPLQAMLVDKEPNLPFAFHWANQQWTATWQGKGKAPGELLQAQHYPNASDPVVEEHYTFLKQFFHHANYIKVAGVPLFMVFQTFDVRVLPILARLRQLAMEDGFPPPGLHIPQFRVNTEHRVYSGVVKMKMRDTRVTMPQFDSDSYYPSNHNLQGSALPVECSLGYKGNETRPVYLSVLTTFDNSPRRDTATSAVWNRKWSELGVIKSFERDLVETMMYEMCCQDPVARESGAKFIMINAWNEWAEGMVLEPNNVYGRQFLEAIFLAKRIVKRVGCSWDAYHTYVNTFASKPN